MSLATGPALPVGKLRGELLADLFARHVALDPRVVLGPRVGEDAAVIASGALLVALDPADAGIVLHGLARAGIDAAFIGRVVPPAAGVTLVRAGRPGPLPRFPQDEITRLFG